MDDKEKDGTRHTARTNAGVPPPRLGINVDAPNTSTGGAQRPDTLPVFLETAVATHGDVTANQDSTAGNTPQVCVEGFGDNNSKRSSNDNSKKTTASQIRIQELQLEADRAMADLEFEVLNAQERVGLLKIRITEGEASIKELEADYSNPESDESIRKTATDAIKFYKTEVRQSALDLQKEEIKLQTLEKSLQTKKALIQKKLNLDNLKALEEEEQDGQKSEVDRRSLTKQWALQQSKLPPVIHTEEKTIGIQDPRNQPKPTVPPNPDVDSKIQSYIDGAGNHRRQSTQERGKDNLVEFDGMLVTEEDADLMRRLKAMNADSGDKQPENKVEESSSTPQPNVNDTLTLMQGIAGIIAEAYRGATPTSTITPDVTRTLLSRQVQGRDLPKFSGATQEWPAFIAAYESSNLTCRYTDAENLSRLQKALQGDAKKMVEWLLISPASVPQVIADLRTRYGNPENIIQSLIQRVREVAPVSRDRIQTLLDFGIAVRNLTATIIALKQPTHLSNPSLLNELMRKLTLEKQIEWAKLKATKAVTLEDFANWIKIETDAAYTLGPDEKTKEGNPRFSRNQKVHSTSERTPAPGSSNYPSKPRKCGSCNKEGHRTFDCPELKSMSVDKRWDLVKKKQLCSSCLNYGHLIRDCRSKRKCGIQGCSREHNRLLHGDRPATQRNSENKDVKLVEEISSLSESESSSNEEHKETVNPTIKSATNGRSGKAVINVGVIPVLLRGPKGTVKTFAELDNGATITVIDAEVADQIGLRGKKLPFTVNGFQSTTVLKDSEEVKLDILTIDGKSRFPIQARTVTKLKLCAQSVRKIVLDKWKHLRGLPIDPYEDARPTILIGLDNPQILTPREVRSGKGNSPYATRTQLGWILMGPVNSNQCGRSQTCHYMNEQIEDPLHELVKFQFSTESFGVTPNFHKPRSREDIRAQEILDATIKKTPEGWETGLLWREETPSLPSSKANAYNRLLTMERKMDREPEFAKAYYNKIDDYMEKGYARVLSPEEARKETGATFYLPHFMAKNEKKPGKLRFVFDAAARTQGSCLNDHLLQGPDKIASLPGVLFKFRQREIGITADIMDMFHRVRVREEDSDAQRFLWRGKDREREPDIMKMQVLIFGASCSPVCATEAKNRNAETWKDEFPHAYEAIVKRHYVDDYLDSCDTVKETLKRREEVQEVHQRGNFLIRNWLSSSDKVMEQIPEELRAPVKNISQSSQDDHQYDLAKDEETSERVLGLFWRPHKDDFTFSLTYLKAKSEIWIMERLPTKREMLSLVMSVYDPLGLISVLTVKARMLLQATWRMEVDWNDPIPEELRCRWSQWLRELSQITTFTIPRCYSPTLSTATEVQLHIFCDASEEAFGAVGYFRIDKDQEVTTAFVMSKARVAPMKALSLPRLELQGAVKAARLAKFIREEHEIKINRTIFWTDSSIVMSWIRSDSRRFQQFISHRIGEIQELTNMAQWRWIPTNENVSDELTRFETSCDWSARSRWINGPSFLLLPEEQWPQEPAAKTIDLSAFELKPQIRRIQPVESVLDVTKFSSWRKLLRVTSYIKRVWTKPKMKTTAIQVEELQRAAEWWTRKCQENEFPDEIALLKKKRPLEKSSRLFKLSPYLDEDGILRVRGRLDNAELPTSVKRPIILPPKHPVTTLIVREFHEKCGHQGFERIVNEIRQNYYIFHVRAAVKRSRTECQKCMNDNAKPVVPEMGQLPKFRLEGYRAVFTSTGVDYFGPIDIVVKRSREKRYGVLFTCLATRAVHLELAGSLSTDSCIMAIQRFVSRRGTPEDLHSDNGTNFHGAANELTKALEELDLEKLTSSCATQGIRWHFIPPAAPHMGGSWERMIQSLKKTLGEVLKKKPLTEEVLYTLLVEAEHTVNSHPLTHVPDDPQDPEALTPNHFLLGRSSNMQPMGRFDDKEIYGRKQWRIVQQLANSFWRRWVHEYLPTLLRRTKWCQQTKPIEVGDVVLEVDANLPRNTWPKGIVTQIYPGRDGVTRVVDIMLGRNGHTHKRPVSRLCILDVIKKEEKTTP